MLIIDAYLTFISHFLASGMSRMKAIAILDEKITKVILKASLPQIMGQE